MRRMPLSLTITNEWKERTPVVIKGWASNFRDVLHGISAQLKTACFFGDEIEEIVKLDAFAASDNETKQYIGFLVMS